MQFPMSGAMPEASAQYDVLVLSYRVHNLHAAILYLHRSYHIRDLWIDAISIDQENISERNIQVPLMRDIYARAAVINVWLGPQLKGWTRLGLWEPYDPEMGRNA